MHQSHFFVNQHDGAKEIGGISRYCVICWTPVNQAETREIGGGSKYCVICHTTCCTLLLFSISRLYTVAVPRLSRLGFSRSLVDESTPTSPSLPQSAGPLQDSANSQEESSITIFKIFFPLYTHLILQLIVATLLSFPVFLWSHLLAVPSRRGWVPKCFAKIQGSQVQKIFEEESQFVKLE